MSNKQFDDISYKELVETSEELVDSEESNFDDDKNNTFGIRCLDCGIPIKHGYIYCKSCFLKRRKKYQK